MKIVICRPGKWVWRVKFWWRRCWRKCNMSIFTSSTWLHSSSKHFVGAMLMKMALFAKATIAFTGVQKLQWNSKCSVNWGSMHSKVAHACPNFYGADFDENHHFIQRKMAKHSKFAMGAILIKIVILSCRLGGILFRLENAPGCAPISSKPLHQAFFLLGSKD